MHLCKEKLIKTLSKRQKKWFALMDSPQKTAFRQSVFSLKAQLFK